MAKEPKPTQMYDELARHYSVERGSKTMNEYHAAVKKAAGAQFDSVEEIWRRWKAVPAKAAVVSAPAPGQMTKMSPGWNPQQNEVILPTHSVKEGHSVVHVHSPPAPEAPVLYYPPRDWLETATRSSAWAQTLALGFLLGLLVSRHALKFLGF